MEEALKELLRRSARAYGIDLTDGAVAQFEKYTDVLINYNQRVNLTAITGPREIVLKHYIDSLSLLGCVPIEKGAALVDVGSGAGFPGMPLKIARPDLGLTCVDSLNKRIAFLDGLAEILGLTGCSMMHMRAEEAGRSVLRGRFDIATARAVAKLSVLAEYCLPLIKVGGLVCAMKGPEAADEVEGAKTAVRLVGGEVEKVHTFHLPGTEIGRTIIVIRKTVETSTRYPRPTTQIGKKPL